ncbi:MAG: sporulation protein YqfD [Clostridia bacterium]|nr:sporulation protein YqfD [Clostridia bacterium]
MNLIYILRFIRGYVIFEIKGGFIERFINLCAVNRIHIWDVEKKENSLSAGILIKNFKALRPILKKSGNRIKIKSKFGIPFFLHKNRKRIGLLFSALFFVAFFIIMNQFVWTIEVEGTEAVSHEEIIDITEELGLKVGSFIPHLKTSEISRNAVNYFDERLMWMAINIKGSKAVIEVRDYIDEHEDKQFKDPCNLIADFDGTLLSVEVFNGDQEVSEGNAVKKGDLLISGVIENRDLSCVYYEARGRITALHNVTDSYEYSCNMTEFRSFAETKSFYTLKILGLEIPLYFSKTDHRPTFQYDKFLCFNGHKLPFGFEKAVSATEGEITKVSTELLFALDSYTADFYEKYKNTNILSCETNFKKNGDTFNITSNLSCIDFMGEQSPIYVEFYEN